MDKFYYNKYIKYRTKYLKLKNKIYNKKCTFKYNNINYQCKDEIITLSQHYVDKIKKFNLYN